MKFYMNEDGTVTCEDGRIYSADEIMKKWHVEGAKIRKTTTKQIVYRVDESLNVIKDVEHEIYKKVEIV